MLSTIVAPVTTMSETLVVVAPPPRLEGHLGIFSGTCIKVKLDYHP